MSLRPEPTKFELIINVKTAKTLGLAILANSARHRGQVIE